METAISTMKYDLWPQFFLLDFLPLTPTFSIQTHGQDHLSKSIEKPVAASTGGDDEIDPLDAFMSGLDEKVDDTPKTSLANRYEAEDEHEDNLAEFAKERAKKSALEFKQGETLEDLDYDSDEMPLANRKKVIESLAPLDHRAISYEPFDKIFFNEAQTTSTMTDDEVAAARKALKITTSGFRAPRLITTFPGFGFPDVLLKAIAAESFERPTPIQMQAVPVAMSGRDVLGVAATGSGKTLSFVWPMLVHVSSQKALRQGEPGPIGIIVAPTRELAQQIFNETKKFAKSVRDKAIRVAPILGGMGKGDTRMMLKSSAHEIVVATPGRLIDVLKTKLLSTYRTTMLVLDEADKMFDMGFEPQIKSIVGQIRPDRQTLLFSATFKPTVENLARDILTDPVRITVGTVGAANQDVTQVVEIVRDDDAKWAWLASRLLDFTMDGAVLIFAGAKAAVDDLCLKIRTLMNLSVASLHGDKTPDERNQIMTDFKHDKFKILVATDLAARGLDVKSIRTVVNYQSAKDIDSHTHRIGRTGRAGDTLGIAYSLLTPNEVHFAGQLVKNLETAKQDVPPELLQLAQRSNKFRPSHNQGHSARHHDHGPRGGEGGPSQHSYGQHHSQQRDYQNPQHRGYGAPMDAHAGRSHSAQSSSSPHGGHSYRMPSDYGYSSSHHPQYDSIRPHPTGPQPAGHQSSAPLQFVKSAEVYSTVGLPPSQSPHSSSTTQKPTKSDDYDPFGDV